MNSRDHKEHTEVNKYTKPSVTLLALALALALPSSSLAAANDDFANATVIGSLPFSDSIDITQATTEPGEPQFCVFSPKTVWYSFAPGADAVVRVDTNGSSFSDTSLTVYQAVGPGFGGLSFLNCTSFGGSVTFGVQAGVTYYIQAGSIFSGSGILQVNLQEIPPPPNDDFESATTIAALPFNDAIDIQAASVEVGEPIPSCAAFAGPVKRTAWYVFTSSETNSISASIPGSSFPPVVAAYTRNSENNLSEVGSRCFGGHLTFRAEAGTTYYIQVAGLFGQGGPLQFKLEVTPPPMANFFFYRFDPSIFDTIQFSNFSSDPGDAGFQPPAWNFGDGATSTDFSPTHRYTADGDYRVQLTVTTLDGRTASTFQIVQVRTHDVAISRFMTPNAASAGHTRDITVGVNSQRYLENVTVQLLKSLAGGGDEIIGALTQSVPVRSANRTTDFSFSYTFTSDDASIGKVTFRAVATIAGARDALPGDNEAIAPPTKVTR